jgi:hypothetical protein
VRPPSRSRRHVVGASRKVGIRTRHACPARTPAMDPSYCSTSASHPVAAAPRRRAHVSEPRPKSSRRSDERLPPPAWRACPSTRPCGVGPSPSASRASCKRGRRVQRGPPGARAGLGALRDPTSHLRVERWLARARPPPPRKRLGPPTTICRCSTSSSPPRCRAPAHRTARPLRSCLMNPNHTPPEGLPRTSTTRASAA